jgi:gliding motility-associated-like protein
MSFSNSLKYFLFAVAVGCSHSLFAINDFNDQYPTEKNPVNRVFVVSPIAAFDFTYLGPLSQIVEFKDLSTAAVSWLWDFGDGNTSNLQNPTHRYTKAGEYSVRLIVQDQDDLYDTATSQVTILEDIIIPNVFSPNGDGINDWFYISNTGLKDFHIEVYNRWGVKVWEAIAPEIRWDGRTSSGLMVSEGTYFFILRATGAESGTDYSTSGTVTLFR